MTRTIGRTLVRYGAPAFAAVALLASLAAAQEPPQARRQAGPRPGLARLEAQLGLTSEQAQALEKLRQGRQEERRAFRGEMSKLRNEMRGLRQDPKADPARMDALIEKGARLRAEGEKRAFRARAERDKILTPEQQEKLRALRSRYPGRADFAGRGRMARPYAHGRWHRHPRWRW